MKDTFKSIGAGLALIVLTLLFGTVLVSIVYSVVGVITDLVSGYTPPPQHKTLYQLSDGSIIDCDFMSREQCGIHFAHCTNNKTYYCSTNVIEFKVSA